MEITHSKITITPELAARFLEFNANNRPLSQSWVKTIAKAITDGSWRQTHQGIAFSGDITSPRRLMDGQHRLAAVVKAGTSIDAIIAWNVPEDSFSAMDDSKTRNFKERNKWAADEVTFASTVFRCLGGSARMDIVSATNIMNRLGFAFRLLINACPTKARSLSTANVWLGAVMAMQKTGKTNEIAAAYRALVLGDVAKMPNSIAALYAYLITRSTEVRSGREAQLQASFIAFSDFNRKRFNSDVGIEIRTAIKSALE